jgi:putative endonuclease
MTRRELGAWGEGLALRHLEAKGYHILARNWRTARGELDLVARDGDTIVFVEVKTRTSRAYGWPEEAFTRTKGRRLQRAAWSYLETNDLLDAAWRVDLVAIDRAPSGALRRLEHYVDVVDGDPAKGL